MTGKSVAPFLILLLSLSAAAQQPPGQAAPQSAEPSKPARPVDPKVHEKALQLTQLSALRQQIQTRIESTLQQGKDLTLRQSSQVDPAFGDEWVKRMRSRIHVEDFIAVYVRVYEKYFTLSDLQELIDAQGAVNDSRPPTRSQPLQDKIKSTGIAMQKEVLDGCAEIVTRVGKEVSLQIEKEHPGWVKTAKPAEAQPNKQ
jgi:hypothetical protein